MRGAPREKSPEGILGRKARRAWIGPPEPSKYAGKSDKPLLHPHTQSRTALAPSYLGKGEKIPPLFGNPIAQSPHNIKEVANRVPPFLSLPPLDSIE